MKLSEALRIIDDTVGMFRTFAEIVQFGDLKEKFLLSHVESCVENYVDFENIDAGMECRRYYTYAEKGKEYKKYVVDIHPVCSYMIDEWPLPAAKKIRKLLNQDFQLCFSFCEEIYGKDNLELSIPLEENYNYQRKYSSLQGPSTIEDVMFDTIHEMFHALGVIQELEEDGEETTTGEDMIITEESASQMDWVKLTDRFDLEKIMDVVKNTGKSNEEKRIVVKAIFDSLLSIDKLYNIPYAVDKLILQLYQEYGGQLNDLSPVKVNKKNNSYKPKLPAELAESEYWKKIKEAGLVDNNNQPSISRTEAAILADILLEKLKKGHKWTIFEKIWNRKNMRTDFQDAQNLNKYHKVREKIKKILD